MAQPEVGPNDIVIHLVNPYKCGDCGLEFCLRSLFLEHLAEHIETLKTETPCHQIVCATSLMEQQPNSITVTRDILQINEQEMFELQDLSLDYSQLTPLKLLEQAGILNLPHPQPALRPDQPKPSVKDNPIILDVGRRDVRDDNGKVSLLRNQQLCKQETPAVDVSVLTTSSMDKMSLQDCDASTSDLDIVQQAVFGDDKMKREYIIKIENPVQLDSAQTFTEIISQDSEDAKFDSTNEKSNSRRREAFPAVKGKGVKKGVVCLICSHEFANASVLERHQVIHTGAKPYSCNVCFKEFNDISSHRKHLLIHKRQHRCPVCHSMYLRRTQLLLHMKQHRKKRFLQFGNNFHEVQVNVTRNDEGQLVQEYNLLILSGPEGNENKEVGDNVDSSREEELMASKTESVDALAETKSVCSDTRLNDDSISDLPQEGGQTEADHKRKIIYRCGHCKKLIFTRPTLSRHLIKHTNTRPFQCDQCMKYFRDKADLLHHHKTHTKPVQCKICLSSFSKVLYLQNHLLKGCPVTDNDSRFTVLPDLRCECNICKKILKNKANILRHLKVHVFQERNKSKCQSEGETLATAENLNKPDLEKVSQNVEDHFQPLLNSVGFHCLICGQEFRFKSFMVTHVRMHLNQRPFKCPDCPKSFFARLMLKKHQQNHTRPYNCPACNKSFIRRYLMKEHFKKRHEQEDPLKDITELLEEKLIQCDICGKIMKSCQKSLMLCHIRFHKDVRPFKCKTCQKSFISDNALRKHCLNHTKPYKCQVCGKGFSRRYLLTDHFRKKCARKKIEKPAQNGILASNEDVQSFHPSVAKGDSPAVVVNSSTECRPFEAKVITEHDFATGDTIYTCEPCDKRFTQYDSLMRHINTFSRPTACKYCKQTFDDKHLTMSHQRSCLGLSLGPLHKFSKPTRALGEQQEKVQKIMKEMIKKIETLTTPSENIVGDVEISERILENTKISEANTASGPNADKALGKVFPKVPTVKPVSLPVTRTLCILKEEKGKFSCPECDRGFGTPRGLKIHASSHVRLFKCDVCDKDFTQISSLRAHAKIHKTGMKTDVGPEVSSAATSLSKNRQKEECVVSSEKRKDEDDTSKEQSVPTETERPGRKKSWKVSAPVGDKDHDDEKRVEHRNLEEVGRLLMQAGTRGRPYSCKMCRRRFTDQTGLNAHMLQNHGVKS